MILLLLPLGCGNNGGQSGTDQFEVDHVNPGNEPDDDAGSSEPEPESDPRPGPDAEGTSSDGESDAGRPEPELPVIPDVEMICDGTDHVRFSATFGRGGGPFAFYNGFLPGTYITIDGKCRYWINDASLRGLRSGVLSDSDGERFSALLHYGQYQALTQFEVSQCPDGGSSSLTDATGTLTCRCGDCGFGPAELHEPFAGADELFVDLTSRDEWAWGPTTILPVSMPVEADALDWTLPLDLDGVAYDGGLEQPFGADMGVPIPDDQLELFSVLRQTSIVGGETSQLSVVDEGGGGYVLFVRDEPPAEVLDALEADVHE